MIKRMSLKKITISCLALTSVFLLYIFPTKGKLKIKQELEYIESKTDYSNIYLLDSNNYLALTSIDINDDDIKIKATELLTALINGEKYEDKIPNGFKSIIPSDTKILSLKYKDNVIKVDFSSDLMDTKMENEEKIIEAIIYTLTSIDDVKYVIIYMDGELLTKLPKSNITLPSTLDRSYGINKKYDISSLNDITKTTIYYINKNNDEEYYVPVTLINNDNREKAEIIIEELSQNITYNNLMSYLNNNTQIVSLENNENTIKLDLTENVFSDKESLKVLDEVIYTISMSIKANYNVDNIILTSNNQEIYKSN